jgi:hypothetical protein
MIHSRKTVRLLSALLSALLLALALASAADAALAWPASNIRMPVHFLRSADCTGETVEISGTIHLLNQVEADGSLIGHFNYQGVTGLGLTSGALYQASTVDHLQLSAPFPSSIHSVQSFRLISRGPAGNLLCMCSTI